MTVRLINNLVFLCFDPGIINISDYTTKKKKTTVKNILLNLLQLVLITELCVCMTTC